MAHIYHILQWLIGANIYVRRFFSIVCRILIVYIVLVLIEHKITLILFE